MSKPKYFWLKLDRNFFKRHDIRIVESMPNGKDYVLFYLKLLVESLDHVGELRFNETIPYNPEMLSTITNTNIDIVKSAIEVFKSLELMEVWDDHTIFLSETQKLVGETSSTHRVRRHRANKKALELALQKSDETPCNVTVTENETKIDIEIEKEIDIEIDIYKDILSFWNNQKIVQHRKMTDTIRGRINSKISDYSIEEIKQSILNYSYILQSEDYFLDYRWTFVEFMDRGFEKMLVWELAEKSYRRGNIKVKESNPFAAMLREME